LQSKAISTKTDVEYHRLSKARAILKMMKGYSRQDGGNNDVRLDGIDLEYSIDAILELIDLAVEFMGEVACGAWYLLIENKND